MAIYARTQQKHDIEANWIKAVNFIPLAGELIIYDTDEYYTYERFKIGDGVTNVNDLPFSTKQADWNQNDIEAADYVKNRTHGEFIDNIPIGIFDGRVFDFTNGDISYSRIGDSDYLPYKETGYFTVIWDTTVCENCYCELWEVGHAIMIPDKGYIHDYVAGLCISSMDNGKHTITLIDPDAEKGIVVKKLDEKYIPDTIARNSQVTKEIEDSSLMLLELIESTNEDVSDILKQIDKLAGLSSLVDGLTPIDLLAKFNAKPDIMTNWWPIEDVDILLLLQNGIKDYSQTELFSIFHFFYNKYNNFKVMPVFKLTPGEMNLSARSVRLCSTTKIELDSVNAKNGSTVDPEFNLMYYIDFSENNTLKINFNYMIQGFEDGTTSEIPWDNLNSSNGIMTITFELLSKSSGTMSPEQIATYAQEQIITPALTEEVY